MSNKCAFCGGDNAVHTGSLGKPLCDLCYRVLIVWCIDAKLLDQEIEESIKKEAKVKLINARNDSKYSHLNWTNYSLVLDQIDNLVTKEMKMHKCSFCGGPNDRYGLDEHEPNLCKACFSCVNGNLTDGCVVDSATLLESLRRFGERAKAYNVESHPNIDLAFKKNLECPIKDDKGKFQQEISSLKEQLKGFEMIKEGHARATVDNKRLTDELANEKTKSEQLRQKYDGLVKFMDKAEIGCRVLFERLAAQSKQIEDLKQQRNDWEKVAGEYRFKADRLSEEKEKLETEIEDLVKENEELDNENEDLCEENEELCQQVEDLDGEAEQYFQNTQELKTELAKWKPQFEYTWKYYFFPMALPSPRKYCLDYTTKL